MPDFIGNIEVPEIVPVGTFPIVPDYGFGRAHPTQVIVHQFGSANAKIEQRFLLGTGAKRFTVRRARLNETDRIALRDFWEARQGGYGAFTYNAPNDDGNGTTAYTCRFANEPLSWEFLSDAISSAGVTLIEIPTSSPEYTLNSTLTRFPSVGLQTALLSQVQQIIPLIKIQCREAGYPAIYVSDRRCTVGAQLYLARLLEFDGISQSIGNESDEAQFTFGNADRVLRDLSGDTDLFRASLEFSLFHVGTGIKLDLWKGEIVDWQYDDGPEFRVTAADGIYELTLPYPTRRISRTCWKTFDDGNGCPYTTEGSGGDPDVCDKGYDSANGCQAHGMKRYFGGVIAEPQGVRIKDNSTGTWGYGRSSITSTSLVAETIYDQVVPEIYTDSPMPVNCKIAAGREESDFYAALGIVGEGPLTFGSGHKLDGQYHHGYPGNMGLRYAQGFDPALVDDKFSLGPSYKDNYSAGLAFLELRRHDEKGLQLSQVSGHDMQAIVATGLQGWAWTGVGSRSLQTITNPIWVVVNAMLRAKGLRYANAATAEAYLDVDAATVAAAICDDVVDKIIGSGTETQFKFRGVLQEEKPLRDWIQEILMNCLGYYSFAFGKLKLGVRVNSSVVEAFTEGNILFQSLQLSALKPTFNHLTANFADEEFEFAANAVSLYEIDHAKQIGSQAAPLYLKANLNLSGSSSKSQAARIVTTRLREELGGITAAQWRDARQLSFRTTVLALNTEPGMVCSMTHDNMPGGAGEFRVMGWRLNRDFSIDITGKTTVDEMYDLVVGPKPADVTADPLPVEPPGWNQRAVGGKNVGGAGNASGTPTVTELFVQDDQNPDLYHRKVKLEFTPPPTAYADSLTRRAQASTPAVFGAGGSIPGDQVLYVEVCARAGGVDGLASDPLQILIPAGTNTNKFTFQCRLPDAAMTHYQIRVGPHVGRTFALGGPIASPGTDWFEITVTDVSALNSASLSPDPRFHHVRVFYYYDGSPETIRDGGTTSGPSDTELIFQPEPPEAADTQVTLILCSENELETDRYPFDNAPSMTLGLTKDTGNPAGASGLQVLTNADDSAIPLGCVAAKFNRDTTNFESIIGVAFVTSSSLPAQGPYAAERAAHPTATIETGTCTVMAGSKIVTVTRASNPDVVGRILLIWTNDASPDSDLEGEFVETQGVNSLTILTPFHKSGTFNYAIIKRWWDREAPGETTNLFYAWVPVDQFGSLYQSIWRTPSLDVPASSQYMTVYSRNLFGVGTRITSALFTVPSYQATEIDAVLPGVPTNFSVTGGGGRFTATWGLPATGYKSLCDVAIQYATDAGFTQNVVIVAGLGKIVTIAGEDPNKSYHWRLAWRNQSGLPSDAAVAAALAGHADWFPATGWGPFCVAVGPVSSGQVSIGPRVVTPRNLSQEVRAGNFLETWEEQSNCDWAIAAGAASYVNDGVTGGYCLRIAGIGVYQSATYNGLLAYDPSKLYRIRIRARRPQAVADPTKSLFYFGLLVYDKALGDLTWFYPVCAGIQINNWTLNQWYEYTGWVRGSGAPFNNANDPANPTPCPSGTSYIRPFFLPHYDGGPAGNVLDLDYVAIDILEEEGENRVHSGLMPSGAPLRTGGWNETFEKMPDWEVATATGTQGLGDAGLTGGKAYYSTGYVWLSSKDRIPFDPSKLYRMRARVYRSGGGGNPGSFYVGLTGFLSDKVTKCNANGADSYGSQHYVCMSSVLPGFDQWLEYTGWVKGTNNPGSTSPSGDPANPAKIHPNVRYFSPMFILNYSTGTEYQYIDEIVIDVFDEDGQARTYSAINPGPGFTIVANRVVPASIQDMAVNENKLAATARAQHSVLVETFDQDVSSNLWVAGSSEFAAPTYPLNGEHGGRALNCNGGFYRIYGWTANGIPFNPNLLYRWRIKWRRTATVEPGQQNAYFLAYLTDASKNPVAPTSYRYLISENLSGLALSTWFERTCWVKGFGGGGSGTPTDPYQLHSGTKYFHPCFILNWNMTYSGNFSEVDSMMIEAFDEDGQNRLYLGIASNGDISPDKVITTSIKNDAITTPKIAAYQVTAGKISVATLDAISATFGTITSGTVIGCTVKTAGSGNRAELNTYGLETWAFSLKIVTIDWSGINVNNVGAPYRVGGVTAIDNNAWFVGPMIQMPSGGQLYINNKKILDARRTGWSGPSGTATRSGFDTSTVTLSQLAERVKALIDDLMAHGLIQAT